MLKKISILLISVTMILFVSACGTSEQTSESKNEEAVTGGWEMHDNEASVLPEDVQTAFDNATETFTGSELKPVVYVASQAVAGTNYMILCEAATTTETPAESYQMVVVYSDPDGNAEITQIKEFDLTAYTEGDGSEISTEKLAGGWEVAEDRSSVVIPQEAKDALAAFESAAAKAGVVGELISIDEEETVETEVNGTNYAFLCFSTLQTEETINGIQVVTVYADTDGNAEISNICTVDPARFNE